MPARAHLLAIWVGIILAALIPISCGDGLPPEFPCPEFTLKNPMTKTEVSRAAIEGKPTVIYWFASW